MLLSVLCNTDSMEKYRVMVSKFWMIGIIRLIAITEGNHYMRYSEASYGGFTVETAGTKHSNIL